MKKLHILNPAAGKGALPDVSKLDGEVYITKCAGDAEAYLITRLSDGDGEEYRIYAYGGDGTLNEVTSGIMRAGAGGRVVLTPVPTGSGNDFARMTADLCDAVFCDVIKYNDKYAINEINTGFDTGVVVRSNSLKKLPLVSGTASYILGVVAELISKKATELRLTLRLSDGSDEVFEGKYLLCLLSNGAWYGGGFKAAPTADISDGVLDFYLASDMGRARFLGLVGKYRAGEHIDMAAKTVIREAEDVLIYRRCTSLLLEGVRRFSADGEVMENDGVITAEVIPSALRVAGPLWEPLAAVKS